MPDPKRYEEFADLIRLHTSQVLAYINATLLNWNDSDDLFQETCLVLWQKFDEFEPGTNFLAWALRIADYKVLKHRAKQSRYAAFTDKLRDVLKAKFAVGSGVDPTTNLAALTRCMNRLAEADRQLATQCYGENVPVRQVADAMGRSPESVHRSLRRVRKWLLDCVRREWRQAEAPAAIPSATAAREEPS